MADFSVAVLRRVSSDMSSFSDGREIPEDVLDSFIVSLEFVYRELVVLGTTSQLTQPQNEALGIVRSCLSTLKSIQEQHQFSAMSSFHPVHPVQTGAVGRPSFDVSPDQLTFLIDNQFSVPQIADMIGVSVGQYEEE